jgi:cardiolipin hydrolase
MGCGGSKPVAPPVLFFPDPGMPCRAVMNGQQCRRGAKCTYSHQKTSLVKFLDELYAARKTLDVCVFTITCNEIAEAIIAAKKRGVKVRVITDDEQAKCTGSDVYQIASEGIETRTDSDPITHMHHKFAIIDKKTLLNGSFNWTRQAVLGNRENVVIMRNPALCDVFTKEFNAQWKLFAQNKVPKNMHQGGGGGQQRNRV